MITVELLDRNCRFSWLRVIGSGLTAEYDSVRYACDATKFDTPDKAIDATYNAHKDGLVFSDFILYLDGQYQLRDSNGNSLRAEVFDD